MADSIIETVRQDILLMTVDRTDIIDVATQGPAGPPGIQGFPGPPGGASLQFDAATSISGHRAVLLDANGRLIYASADNITHMGRVVGITAGAAEAGAPCNVQNFDRMVEGGWSWTPDAPIFLGTNGALTQTPPTIGFLMVIGFAISPTTLFVSLREPILLTA